MSTKTFIQDRFNDAALTGQRLEGWLRAQRDFSSLTDKIQAWREMGPVSGLDVLQDIHADTQRFYEIVQLKRELDFIKEQADSGMIALVSDRFYRDAVFAEVNANRRDSIDERAIGYKSFWHDAVSILDKKIDISNDYYQGKDGFQSPFSPPELASALRLKSFARAVLRGQSADEAFAEVYRPASPRAWFPPQPHTYVLPSDETQAADMVENKYQQLKDNLVGMLFGSAVLAAEKEVNSPLAMHTERILKMWFVALVKERDEAAPLINKELGWFDRALPQIGEILNFTAEAARAEEQKFLLPFHPLMTFKAEDLVPAIRLAQKPEPPQV